MSWHEASFLALLNFITNSCSLESDKHIKPQHRVHFVLYLRHVRTRSITQFSDLLTRYRHLMYTVDASGKRVYSLKKIVNGAVAKSAHPARFSPDDKYSRYAIDGTMMK